MIHQWISGSR